MSLRIVSPSTYLGSLILDAGLPVRDLLRIQAVLYDQPHIKVRVSVDRALGWEAAVARLKTLLRVQDIKGRMQPFLPPRV